MILILMGVSGCGKSSIGHMLAEKLHWAFEDGDDYHTANNKTKMASGVPLDDKDRYQWLLNLNSVIERWQKMKENGIIVCSALKRKYRQVLIAGLNAKYFDNRVILFSDTQDVTKETSSQTKMFLVEAEEMPFRTSKDNLQLQISSTDCEVGSSDCFQEECSQENRIKESSNLKETESELDLLPNMTNNADPRLKTSSLPAASAHDEAPLMLLQQKDDHQGYTGTKDDPILPSYMYQHPEVLFVHLNGTMDLISSRLNERRGHFFNPALLQSQFDTLEELDDDENGVVVDISHSMDSVVSQIAAHILPLVSEPR